MVTTMRDRLSFRALKWMRGAIQQRVAVGLLTMSLAGTAFWYAQENPQQGDIFPPHVPTKGDVPTIGFGSTRYEDGTPVKMTDPPISRSRAEQLAKSLNSQAEKQFAKSMQGAELLQVEFDIDMDFVGQYGMGSWNSSPMRGYQIAGDYVAACKAFLSYRFMTSAKPIKGWKPYRKAGKLRWRFDCSTPGNKICRGVWTRQLARYEKCMAAQK